MLKRAEKLATFDRESREIVLENLLGKFSNDENEVLETENLESSSYKIEVLSKLYPTLVLQPSLTKHLVNQKAKLFPQPSDEPFFKVSKFDNRFI